MGVITSESLAPGSILTIELEGREIVVWRSESGGLGAVDAR